MLEWLWVVQLVVVVLLVAVVVADVVASAAAMVAVIVGAAIPWTLPGSRMVHGGSGYKIDRKKAQGSSSNRNSLELFVLLRMDPNHLVEIIRELWLVIWRRSRTMFRSVIICCSRRTNSSRMVVCRLSFNT